MASTKKIIEKMRNQPNGVRFSEAKKVLEEYGYKITSQKGSHRVFRKVNGEHLSVVEEKPIKKYHIDEILKKIKA